MQLTQLQFQQAFAQAQQLHRSGRYAEAHSVYSSLAQMSPNQPPILAMMGAVERQMGRLDDAKDHLLQAIKLQPQQAMFHHELSLVHKLSNDFRKAHKSLDKAISLQPTEAAFIAAKSELHHMAGEYDEALKTLEPVVDQRPTKPPVALMYAKLESHHGQSQKCIDLLKACLDRKDIAQTMRTQLLFHLGDLFDAQGQHDEAFAAYQQGNWAKDAHFDSARHTLTVDQTIAAWTRHAVQALPRGDAASERPVFILGMPRSGTSLVEQILCCHPQVHGFGELTNILHFAREIAGPEPQFPMIIKLSTIKEGTLRQQAQSYLKELRAAAPHAARCTDKMPLNCMALGLISILFPKAKVIHCVRDPMDTCLSCYFHFFTGTLPFTYNMTTLGRFYVDYARLMKHWKDVLEIPILEVSYEELVENHESVSRRMVDFIGLEWDDACLRFDESERVTLTSSNQQVRKPVYKTAVKRHLKYVQHLGPLQDALGLPTAVGSAPSSAQE